MAVVVLDDLGVAGAQAQRRVALPLVVEAAGVGEVVAGPGLGDEVHGAAGADRAELAGVADEQQLGAGLVGVGVDRGERGGVGHGGLVDHQQVAAAQPPGLVGVEGGPVGRLGGVESALGGQPAGGVGGGQSFLGEDVGGELGGGQAEHAALGARPGGGGRGRSRRGPGSRRRSSCRCPPVR